MKSKVNLVGAHFSIAKGYLGAFASAVGAGADCLQIFTKSPRSGQLREVKDNEALEVANYSERHKIQYGVIHASYLLNLAKPMATVDFFMKSLIEDVRSAEKLKLDGVVLHLGKSLGGDATKAKGTFVRNIKQALELTDNCQSKIILENTAGQGSEFGWRFDELGEIFDQLKRYKRVKICLDTEHAFAAGYEPLQAIEEFNKQVGLEHVTCLHFNDSKKLLGSRVDRHQDIGFGEIGSEKLKNFVKELNRITSYPLPLILETPEEHLPYNAQIKCIRGWF